LVLTLGIVVSFVAGWALEKMNNPQINWRIMTGIGLLFPGMLVILGLTKMNETRQFRRHVKDEEARALTSSAGEPSDGASERTGFAGLFLDCANFKYVFLGLIFSATLQLTGINAVMYFGPQIIQSAGIKDKYGLNIGVGAWNFLTTFIAVFLVERLGRRKLMIGGTVLLTLALIFIAISFRVFPSGSTTQGIFVGLGLAVYLMGFEGGPGCLFWVVVNEVYPEHIRGAGSSFCNITQWGFNLIVSTTFPIVTTALGPQNTDIIFYIYGGVGVLCVIFQLLLQPETKERRE